MNQDCNKGGLITEGLDFSIPYYAPFFMRSQLIRAQQVLVMRAFKSSTSHFTYYLESCL